MRAGRSGPESLPDLFPEPSPIRPDPRVRRPNSSGRRAGFKKPRLSCRQPEATECCQLMIVEKGPSPCRRRRGLATRHARAPAHSRIVRDRRGERPAGGRPAGGRPRDDPHRARIRPQSPLAISTQHSHRRHPVGDSAARALPCDRSTALASATSCRQRGCAGVPPPSAHSARVGGVLSTTRLRGHSSAIVAQNSQPYYDKESGDFRQYFTIRSAEGHSEGKTRVKTGRNRLPLFDIQRKRYTICYS